MHADPARMEDGLGLVNYAVARMNDEFGASMRASINIGGDPSLIAVAGGWETLGAYATLRAQMQGDAELQSVLRMGASIFSGGQDFLVQIRRPAGDQGPLAVANTARMHMPRVTDAFAFAIEAAEISENATGRPTGIATAVTGDRSQLMWFGYQDDLDAFAADQAKLEADDDYLDLYKRSEDLFVDGSLEQGLWMAVT